MSEYPPHLSRETAERLLDGASPSREADVLARVLRSAAAPARPHELSGEDTAVMAFRSAPRPEPRQGFSWRRLLTFKVIAVIAAATAGGLAFASTTGIIPSPFNLDPGPATPTHPSTSASSSGHGQQPSSPGVQPSAHPSMPVSEAVTGLCHAYLNKPAGERGKLLDTPPFEALVTAAGGVEQVDAYCAAIAEAEKPGERPSDKPDKSHVAKPSKVGA